MEQLINTLVSSLLSVYLPISDVGSRVAISLAIAGLLSNILFKISNFFFETDIVYFWNRKITNVIIEPDNPLSEKILKYVYEKYKSEVRTYKLINETGKNKFHATKFKTSILKDKYTHNGSTYDIMISLEKSVNDQSNNNNNRNNNNRNNNHNGTPPSDLVTIIVKSTATVKIIESYFNDIIFNINTSTHNKVSIYRTEISKRKDFRNIMWKSSVVKLSKNMKNTIVSDSVNKHFYEDIDYFVQNEQFYLDRGLPYKRGYLLHGKPGCGKTSLVKAVANQYKLPIFIIDLNVIQDNSELIHITNDISSHLMEDQKYLVVFEDIDRSKIFRNWYDDNNVTMDCFLNVLDGVDEYHGRITILTANDFTKINSKGDALIRPGRIDTIVELTECTIKQIVQILQFYFNQSDPINYNLDQSILISPAQLTQIILLIGDLDKVIRVLNTNKNFSKINVEKAAGIYHDTSLAPTSSSSSSSAGSTGDLNMPEDEEKEEDPDSHFIRRLTRMKGTNAKYDFQLSQLKDTFETVPGNKIKYERFILNKKSLEQKISDLNRKIETRKYLRSLGDGEGYAIGRRARIKYSS